MAVEELKKQIIYWSRKLNERGFVTARSGNVSLRTEEGKVLITCHDSYLGELEEDEIILVDLQGNVLEGTKEITSEKNLHLAVYRRFEDAKVILHSHSPFTTAFFNYFPELDIFSFEAEFYLGKVPVVEQNTPTVTDVEPVLEALEGSKIAVLKKHGVVAVGENFKEAFSLIELLEEQCRVGFYTKNLEKPPAKKDTTFAGTPGKTYKLLSPQHIEALVEIVNSDKEAQELGRKYGLTTTLAVKNQDTGEAVCFYYQQGRIEKTESSEDAEFVIIGKTDILKKVFNRQIDPFVALTQGKVKTRGDFSKMSKWYPVMVRTFKLWERAKVE